MSYLPCTIFCNFKFSFFEVCKKITSSQMFKYDKYLIWIFEYIEQSNNIRVLTYFQHFDLSFLEL